MKKTATVLVGFLLAALAACSTEADTVDHNMSKDAETFRVQRNIVFINGITDKELLRVEGYCSYETPGNKITVLCKTAPKTYVRHMMVLSDNVTAVVEQVLPSEVEPNHYKFIFRPQTLIPEIDVQTDNVQDQ